MSYGTFSNDGKTYTVNTAQTPGTWYNYVFNDEYYMELSQTLQGKSFIVESYNAQAYICMAALAVPLLRADNVPDLFLHDGLPENPVDFHLSGRVLPGIQDGFNRKGLISREGVKKKALFILPEYYHKRARSGSLQS